MKKDYRCQHWDYRDVRIIWQDFKTTIITILQAIMNTLETNGKRNRRYKEEPSEICKAEKYNNWNKNCNGLIQQQNGGDRRNN